jgi:hypothetical protein
MGSWEESVRERERERERECSTEGGQEDGLLNCLLPEDYESGESFLDPSSSQGFPKDSITPSVCCWAWREETKGSILPALESSLEWPVDFYSLFKTKHTACERSGREGSQTT